MSREEHIKNKIDALLQFWFGWALFYGSIPVLIGFLVFNLRDNLVYYRVPSEIVASVGSTQVPLGSLATASSS